MAKWNFFNARFEIAADRWPWMKRGTPGLLSSYAEKEMDKWGWKATDGMGRFGGGWNYCFGFRTSGYSKRWGFTLYLELLFGTVSLRYRTAEAAKDFIRIETERELAKRHIAARTATRIETAARSIEL